MGVTEAFARQAGTGHCVTGRLGPAGKPGPFMPGAHVQHWSAATEDAGVVGVSLQLDYSLADRGNKQTSARVLSPWRSAIAPAMLLIQAFIGDLIRIFLQYLALY